MAKLHLPPEGTSSSDSYIERLRFLNTPFLCASRHALEHTWCSAIVRILDVQLMVEQPFDELCGGQNPDPQIHIQSSPRSIIVVGATGSVIIIIVTITMRAVSLQLVSIHSELSDMDRNACPGHVLDETFTEEDGPGVPPSDNGVKSPLSESEVQTHITEGGEDKAT